MANKSRPLLPKLGVRKDLTTPVPEITQMPRSSTHATAFLRITFEVVRFAFDHLAATNPYYMREHSCPKSEI